MSGHGPDTVQCHCGQTLQVRHVWQHLNSNHAPPDEPEQPFDYSTLELPEESSAAAPSRVNEKRKEHDES